MSFPLRVSIVVPTLHRRELLARALDSVFRQTFEAWELIVVDDDPAGSASWVLDAYKSPRLTYIRNENSHGGGAARNRGIREACGEYIAFLDDDDFWESEKLARQVSSLDATDQSVGFSITGAKMLYPHGEEIVALQEGVADYGEVALRRFNGFLTPTLMVKKSVFADVGGFDENLPSHQEAELIIRITRTYKGVALSDPLTVVNMMPRDHVGGSSARRIAGREYVLKKHHALFASRPRVLAGHYFWIGLQYRGDREYGRAASYFLQAARLSWNLRYGLHAVVMIAYTALASVKKKVLPPKGQ